MGMIGKLLKALGVAYLAMFAADIYKNFAPRECIEDSQQCVRPLFPSSAEVDVYVYVSPKRKLKKGAFDHPEVQLIHNATNVLIEEGFKTSASLPLESSVYVRQNQSLYAHVVVVRAGLSPNPADHKHENGQSSDIMQTSARLTRFLPRRSERYENLISSKKPGGGRLGLVMSLMDSCLTL